MGFFTQFLAGSVTAGTLSYIFHNTIQTRTFQLSNDLKELSERLNSLSLPAPSPLLQPGEIPTRIPLSEAIKSRWNESLLEGIKTVQNVEWGKVVSKNLDLVKEGYNIVKGKLE